MQILKAQSRSELADRLRPTIKYKSKAIVAYFVFFIGFVAQRFEMQSAPN